MKYGRNVGNACVISGQRRPPGFVNNVAMTFIAGFPIMLAKRLFRPPLHIRMADDWQESSWKKTGVQARSVQSSRPFHKPRPDNSYRVGRPDFGKNLRSQTDVIRDVQLPWSMRERKMIRDPAYLNQERFMANETATRAGMTTWQLDPAHSSVEFAVKHMMLTTVRGRFKGVRATLRGDRDHPDDAGVEVTIDTATIDTGAGDRDAHLRGPDFFDADNFPTITFRSNRVENAPTKEGDRFRVVGDLVIRDAAMEVVLECEYEGRGTDPWGKTRAGFNFRTELDRREWGLKWNQTLETGGVLVAHKVRIEGEVQFVMDSE